ncbi:unnamed protein product [Eruca vesicaria subsp. sativa]|uniref:F-box domain-containing protein n=1 Tax=Eruca vesicaria subsp. sativa TaxID=29727 RepID=A0ABC8M8W0_ERUVS|nr:unnamed protein product [Eruca vesicaria subsp. sativa]
MVKYLSIQWKKRSSSKAMMRRGDFVAPEIPFDLVMEILSRLPAKSLMRFRCVSKLWSGLIRSRYLSNLYLTNKVSSSGEPLFLYISYNFVPHCKLDSMDPSQLLSLTVSPASDSAELSLEPDSDFRLMETMGVQGMVILRGLILYTFCGKAYIYNPTTRQSLNLPAVNTNIFAQQEGFQRYKRVCYFFGHDPVLDQYKIVCNVFERWTSSEFWVFVLEPGGFWKRIEYDDQPRTLFGQGLCINGVIYCWAFNQICFDAVYCFDVRSEKLRVIKTPPHAVSEYGQLVGFIEHGGKPALFDHTRIKETGVSELWVLEDGLGGTWSRKSFVLKPCQRHLVRDINMGLMVHGTGQNNEVILGLGLFSRPCYLLYYDLIKNDLRKVNINREKPYQFVKAMDKYESIMHLET